MTQLVEVYGPWLVIGIASALSVLALINHIKALKTSKAIKNYERLGPRRKFLPYERARTISPQIQLRPSQGIEERASAAVNQYSSFRSPSDSPNTTFKRPMTIRQSFVDTEATVKPNRVNELSKNRSASAFTPKDFTPTPLIMTPTPRVEYRDDFVVKRSIQVQATPIRDRLNYAYQESHAQSVADAESTRPSIPTTSKKRLYLQDLPHQDSKYPPSTTHDRAIDTRDISIRTPALKKRKAQHRGRVMEIVDENGKSARIKRIVRKIVKRKTAPVTEKELAVAAAERRKPGTFTAELDANDMDDGWITREMRHKKQRKNESPRQPAVKEDSVISVQKPTISQPPVKHTPVKPIVSVVSNTRGRIKLGQGLTDSTPAKEMSITMTPKNIISTNYTDEEVDKKVLEILKTASKEPQSLNTSASPSNVFLKPADGPKVSPATTKYSEISTQPAKTSSSIHQVAENQAGLLPGKKSPQNELGAQNALFTSALTDSTLNPFSIPPQTATADLSESKSAAVATLKSSESKQEETEAAASEQSASFSFKPAASADKPKADTLSFSFGNTSATITKSTENIEKPKADTTSFSFGNASSSALTAQAAPPFSFASNSDNKTPTFSFGAPATTAGITPAPALAPTQTNSSVVSHEKPAVSANNKESPTAAFSFGRNSETSKPVESTSGVSFTGFSAANDKSVTTKPPAFAFGSASQDKSKPDTSVPSTGGFSIASFPSSQPPQPGSVSSGLNFGSKKDEKSTDQAPAPFSFGGASTQSTPQIPPSTLQFGFGNTAAQGPTPSAFGTSGQAPTPSAFGTTSAQPPTQSAFGSTQFSMPSNGTSQPPANQQFGGLAMDTNKFPAFGQGAASQQATPAPAFNFSSAANTGISAGAPTTFSFGNNEQTNASPAFGQAQPQFNAGFGTSFPTPSTTTQAFGANPGFPQQAPGLPAPGFGTQMNFSGSNTGGQFNFGASTPSTSFQFTGAPSGNNLFNAGTTSAPEGRKVAQPKARLRKGVSRR